MTKLWDYLWAPIDFSVGAIIVGIFVVLILIGLNEKPLS